MSKRVAIGNNTGVTAIDPTVYDVGRCAICETAPATHRIFGEWLCEDCDPVDGLPPQKSTTWDWCKDWEYWDAMYLDYQQTVGDVQGRW